MDSLPLGAMHPKSNPLANIQDLPFEIGKLITDGLPLVLSLATQLRRRLPQCVDRDDLVAAGNLGLAEAAVRFDSSTGVRFELFARRRVKGAMLDYLRACDWSPREIRRKGRTRDEAIQALNAAGNNFPSEIDISNKMGLPVEDYRRLVCDLSGVQLGSLDVPCIEGSGELLIDRIPNSADENPLALCLKTENRQRLATAIGTLSEREQMILALLYHEELTVKEVAEVLAVSGSRVSQIHSVALERLRFALS